MRFELDASRLHQIAHHNRGTLLGFLARRFAADGCSVIINEPELAAIARNHPDAMGCLLFQTTFAADCDCEAWEFNIASEWRPIADRNPRVLFALHSGGPPAESTASQVLAFHSTRSDISVYWRHTDDGPIVIFHSPRYTIQSDSVGREEKWRFIDLDVIAPNIPPYNERKPKGTLTSA